MVHNGIEYGDMQLICEAYDLLHNALDLSLDDISNVFFSLLVYMKNKTDLFKLELIKILIFRFSKIGIKAIWTHS
jgi:6-phosphogluconate dehydrogenase